MNKYARSIICEFTYLQNREYLYARITALFPLPIVYNYLDVHLDSMMAHFVKVMEQEMSLSDPLPGSTILDQLTYFNDKFIDSQSKFIKAHVVHDEAPIYRVADGQAVATARAPRSAAGDLRAWLVDAGRPLHYRDDEAGSLYDAHRGAQCVPSLSPRAEIVYCDQSDKGLQTHYGRYENTSTKMALNRPDYASTVFGVSTPAADDRLLHRRIFRSEGGVENGIPRYEARLYNRHLERDITEGLRGGERECKLMRHDMTALRRRVER